MNPLRLLVLTAALSLTAHAQNVLLEAEQFTDTGGWDVDQQFMEQMGSSYLLAHGLGVPVKDAVTTVTFPAPGKYRVWVRTRDWVAPWKAPGAPGKFQILVNGTPLTETFGTKGAEWHWQDGGSVEVGAEAKIALHDLTGFEGRCDAVLFSKDSAFVPPNDLTTLTAFRNTALGIPAQPEDGGTFDLVVVGGGIAGTSAAVSAARNGLTVALVQDRPVLGGNGSSEVRVWPEGHTRQKPFTHIGDLNMRAMYGAWDALKNVDGLYPNHRLGWSAFIAGKRESRRLLGDVILSADDFRKGTVFPDPAFPCTWGIDVHSPHPQFDDGLKGDEFIAQATTGKGYDYKGPYWAPYRTLYSRNVANLFMAGRDISVTHEGLGPVRVMRTCGMMGEIVGKAASIAICHNTTPRGVYEKHLPLLRELMEQPGAPRRESCPRL